MKTIFVAAFLTLASLTAQAEYQQINLTVFGMDCAPCAHAIRVSMKGIQGVDTVDVDLNTGLVTIKLKPGNNARMRQINEAVEKNGFTDKDADVVIRGRLSGNTASPFVEVTGTQDRYALTPLAAGADLSVLFDKTVTIKGVLPQAPKGKVSDLLRYRAIAETP
jgi:cation transport ATPase